LLQELPNSLCSVPQDLFLAHDDVFLVINLDLRAGILPMSTRSPGFTSMGDRLPSAIVFPGPTEITSPSIGFSLAVSDDDSAFDRLRLLNRLRTTGRAKVLPSCIDLLLIRPIDPFG